MTPQEAQAAIGMTVKKQQADDKIGLQAATAALPGPLKDVWALVPDIQVGPFKVRRFVDGDFIRLAAFDHKLNSFTAVSAWLENPEPSGKEAWLLNWMLTRPTMEVKDAIKAGPEKVRELAENEFSELSGMQLALIMRAIVEQLATYLGTHIEYKPATEGEADASPPASSQPLRTDSAGS
jgi:hypothetical protein